MEDWQKQLEGFKKDPEAAKKELLRAKSVYEAEQAKGAGNDRLTQISTWANQVRGAAGISNDDADFGVNSTAQRVKELLQGTQKPAGGFKPSGYNLRPTTPKPSVTTAAAPTVTTPTTPAATPTTTTAPSFEQKGTNLINTMYDPTEVLQRIKKQRDIQQQGLNNQERMANENASSNLNQNDVNYHTDVSRLRELMAASGLGQSGDSVTAMVGANTARQQGANQINMDRARMLQNIYEQRSLIDNNAAADEAAALSGNNSQRAAQLLQLMRDTDDRSFRDTQAADTKALQIAQLLGMYNGQKTLAGQQVENARDDSLFNRGMQVANMMGHYNGAPTLQKQSMDFNNGLAEADRTGLYKGSPTMQRLAQDATYTGMYNGNPTMQKQAQDFGMATTEAGITGYYNGNPTIQKDSIDFNKGVTQAGLTGVYNGQKTLQGRAADIGELSTMADLTGKLPDGTPTFAAQQWSDRLGIDWASLKINEKKALADIANQNESLQIAKGNSAWNKDPNNPDNILKQKQIEQLGRTQMPSMNEAYAKAVQLAQNDPRWVSGNFTDEERQALINSFYNNLQPSAVSVEDIAKYLK